MACTAEAAAPGSSKARGCTDLPWLFALAAVLGAAVFVASFALALGDPRRLVNGCDSFGNVCGARNAPMGRLAFSGMDATDRPYLFYLDLADPRSSLKICVSRCPFRALRTMDEVRWARARFLRLRDDDDEWADSTSHVVELLWII